MPGAAQDRQRIESLRASEEFKSRLLACSRDCIKVLDLEGRLLYMNEGGMTVLEICDVGPFLNNSSIGLYPRIVQQRDDQRERLGRGKWAAMFFAANVQE